MWCRVPVDSPQRFRVEILFSPGTSHNPCRVLPIKRDHTLPVLPRKPLHQGMPPPSSCSSHAAWLPDEEHETLTRPVPFFTQTPRPQLWWVCAAVLLQARVMGTGTEEEVKSTVLQISQKCTLRDGRQRGL